MSCRLQRPGEPVDAGDNQGAAGLHELEQHLQLGPAVASRAADLLGTDHLAACCLEAGALGAARLIE